MNPMSRHRARWPMAALFLATLLPTLGMSIANAGLPTFGHVFGAHVQDVQWIVLGYLLAMTTLVVGAGRLGDLFGKRRLLIAGAAIFAIASAAAVLAANLWLLVIVRAMQGVGAAALMAMTTAMARDLAPDGRTGTVMGLLGTASAVGTALGPSLGGQLIAAFGWRAIFVLLAAMGMIALVVLSVALPPHRQHSRAPRRFDALGTKLLAVTLAAYALSMTVGRGTVGLTNMALLAVAGIGFATFLFQQSKTETPLVQLSLLADARIRTGLAGAFAISAIMMTTLVVGPFFLAGALGLSPAGIGLTMSVGPVIAALLGAPAGRLVDRIGPSSVTLVGLVVVTIGCLVLSVLAGFINAIGYAIVVGATASGYAIFQAANNTEIMAGAIPEQRGLVSGLLSLSRNLGLVSGASVMAAIYAWGIGAGDSTPPAVTHATSMTFAVSAGLGTVLVVVVPRLRRRHAGT